MDILRIRISVSALIATYIAIVIAYVGMYACLATYMYVFMLYTNLHFRTPSNNC